MPDPAIPSPETRARLGKLCHGLNSWVQNPEALEVLAAVPRLLAALAEAEERATGLNSDVGELQQALGSAAERLAEAERARDEAKADRDHAWRGVTDKTLRNEFGRWARRAEQAEAVLRRLSYVPHAGTWISPDEQQRISADGP